MGKSTLVPYVHGEYVRARHRRRFQAATEALGHVRKALAGLGLALELSNQDQHWRITGPGVFAEWWPSTAKLVFDREYRRGVHCHDWKQLLTAVGKAREMTKVNQAEVGPKNFSRFSLTP